MMLLYRLEAAGLAHTSRAVLAEYQRLCCAACTVV